MAAMAGMKNLCLQRRSKRSSNRPRSAMPIREMMAERKEASYLHLISTKSLDS